MNKKKAILSPAIESHLAWLYGRINYERQNRVTPRHFKLLNMREILLRLGNPHLDYRVVHVAGTKGKGSVSTMLGKILTSSGLRTGVYTSPHLDTIHQRMAINGHPITDQQFIDTITALKPVVAEMDAESAKKNLRPLTFFEITTAATFYHFSVQQCEAVVLEVGLGGRLDSTNVCEPVACVITNISVDHTRQLGSTIDKIAYEKAGIIKPSIPVISGTLDPVAAQVIANVAQEHDAPIFVLDREFSIAPTDADSDSFTFSSEIAPTARSIPNLTLQLIGLHQRTNAAIAIATTQVLNQSGWEISDDAIRSGLANATLVGRTEVIRQNPTIVVDMAHNVASIRAFIDAIHECVPQWKTCSTRKLIFATSRDKDAKTMLALLIDRFDEIILTKFQNNPRGMCEQELLRIAGEILDDLPTPPASPCKILTAPNPDAAWDQISNDLTDDTMVCIVGSIFLVAELREKAILWSDAFPKSITNA